MLPYQYSTTGTYSYTGSTIYRIPGQYSDYTRTSADYVDSPTDSTVGYYDYEQIVDNCNETYKDVDDGVVEIEDVQPVIHYYELQLIDYKQPLINRRVFRPWMRGKGRQGMGCKNFGRR